MDSLLFFLEAKYPYAPLILLYDSLPTPSNVLIFYPIFVEVCVSLSRFKLKSLIKIGFAFTNPLNLAASIAIPNIAMFEVYNPEALQCNVSC